MRDKPGKHKHQVDTNVFQISMACLAEGGELATGDPVFCSKCQAVFNKHSKIEETKDEALGQVNQIWNCEFCLTKNAVNLEPEEIPKSEAVNYILEAAAQV
jgi:succinate dehydrogenase/fumarate reductase-like Fe-S protein